MHVRASTGVDLTTTLSMGRHDLVVDEPPQLGGADLGPSPTELLAASLAACTAITIQMYLRRKGWQDSSLRVEAVGGDDTEIDGYQLTVHLPASLSDAQVARVLHVAARCPVRRVLSGSPEIREEVRRGTA
ncbi:MAG: OsmC family protein [Thermoleophilaceae bacterium]